MTLIVTLRGTDGIVMAGDSRGTIGDPRGLTAINDTYQKIFRLSGFCGLGISGASELAMKLIDEIQNRIVQANMKFTDPILDETRKIVRNRYHEWFEKFKLEDRPGLHLLIIGYQKSKQAPDMMPRTYLLSSQMDFAPQLSPNGNMLIGVPQYAIYLMHRLYNPKMTVANLTLLTAYLISETATQDPKVGGPIKIATITPAEGYKDLDETDVDDIMRRNEEQNDKLKQFFFGGSANERQI